MFSGALLATADVATDALVEQPEAVRHEVADVGQIEKRQWNADQRVEDRYQSTPRRLRRYVAITCTDTHHLENNRYSNCAVFSFIVTRLFHMKTDNKTKIIIIIIIIITRKHSESANLRQG